MRKGLSLKNDMWIMDRCMDLRGREPLFAPFVPSLVRERDGAKVLSYGLSSSGYDIQLSPDDFRLIVESKDADYVLSPKGLDPTCFCPIVPIDTTQGAMFQIPPHTSALGVSVEKICMPKNIMAFCLGKSTYARLGLNVFCTPLEPGWKGYLTLEMHNTTPNPMAVFPNEGICQIVFFETETPIITYDQRKGKYQDQDPMVTLPKL